MRSIPDEIQDSIELLLEGFESEHTVRAYRRHLESAFRTVTLSPPGGLTAITSEPLGRYRAELLEDGRTQTMDWAGHDDLNTTKNYVIAAKKRHLEIAAKIHAPHFEKTARKRQ